MQKEIKNVDTLISVVHTFLTSPNLSTQPFLKGEMERVRQPERSDREETRKKRRFEVKGTKAKWDLGAKGQKEREREGFWGPGIEAMRDWGLSHIKWGVICLIEVFVSLEGGLG